MNLINEYSRLKRIAREIEFSDDEDSIAEALSVLRDELKKMWFLPRIIFYITIYLPLKIKYGRCNKERRIRDMRRDERIIIRDEELSISLSPCGRLILITLALNGGRIPIDIIYAKATLLKIGADEVVSTLHRMESYALIKVADGTIYLTFRGIMILDKVLSLEIDSLRRLVYDLERIRRNIRDMFK
ncbi:MAG: hypothetical protein J7J99_04055 [Thermoprotei archaeon]|nr:hypothetical protein [Thermoprotei archaeon]